MTTTLPDPSTPAATPAATPATTPAAAPGLRGLDRRDLRARFAPLFARVAAAGLRHEAERTQPFEEVRLLKEAGFGALRVPVEAGGLGVSLEELFALLLDLGAADSNLPQIWRNHLAFVEDTRHGERHARWRRELVGGAFFGGAWSEIGGDTMLDLVTTLTPAGDGDGGDGSQVLNGRKYYSTGSIFSDWVSVLAKAGPEEILLVLVRTDSPGVRLAEDWTGVGQRQTGSGSAFFENVAVPAGQSYPFADRAPYQEAFYQLVHLATLGGIARAAHRDLVDQLRRRTRAYPHALAAVPAQDPQHQEVVGRVGALASSIEASVLWAARALDTVVDAFDALTADAPDGGAPDGGAERRRQVDELLRRATIAVYEAQLTATDAALEAATILYDALGSSALATSTLLDRHWRNARTVSSHNPRVYKARIVGDWHLNGTDPIAAFLGALGTPAAASPNSDRKEP
ncbi:acyl-CoA dehydrogenase [Frankia sp. EI5c]|uniref:acyl-CoA dehydrogenase family protein n=1 Tax=Frankia sp. EI5c TaxID=683316 RepID=UPI0007C3140A|nr:acyl-CoA dehydrogenase family protein [Frankia sp. EI5c]OAA27503.1 acyl-CoA dehydrogenase [Frankia sp. EI5c]